MSKWLKENSKGFDTVDINNPDQFMSCMDSHPYRFLICSCNDRDERTKDMLCQCNHFAYEDGYEAGSMLTCAHCHALGFKGVCEVHLK